MAPSRAAKFKLQNQQGDVLIYSDSFNPNVITDDMPEALKEIVRAFKQDERNGLNGQNGQMTQWDQNGQNGKRARRINERMSGKAVAPLLQSCRHQEYPYNISCPYYKYNDGTLSENPCLTGCVATAIEQVVSFWRHPAVLADTLHGWETDHYTIPDVMPGTPIDWDNILTNYTPGQFTDVQAKAIADLTYYLGVGVHMNWGPGSSGANLFRACDALYDAFDYKTIAFVQRALYSNPSWNRMLRHELENGRPIVYTGHNYAFNGHCFNIDGVDEEGFYHVNWGEDNYACYVDIDYLSVYEQPYDLTQGGMYTGMNMNQTALFMHPDDFEINIWDTLSVDNALYGVVVDTVTFNRQPDVYGRVRADFSLTNTTRDSLNFTFEVMTFLPTDTAVFKQADYVGLTTVNLLPGEHKVWPVFSQFNKTGDRIFGYSSDDETIPYTMPVSVIKGTYPDVEFTGVDVQLLRFVDDKGREDLTARATADYINHAASGMHYTSMGFCLLNGNPDEETRHFDFFEAPAGQPMQITSDFHRLVDGQTYTLQIRYPWQVVLETTFTVRASEAVDGIEGVVAEQEGCDGVGESAWFDLTGRRTTRTLRGIYIHNGKKIIK